MPAWGEPAARGADHRVEPDTKNPGLRHHLFGSQDVAEAADRRMPRGGVDHVRAAARVSKRLGETLHRRVGRRLVLADRERMQRCAQQPIEQQVSGSPVEGARVVHALFELHVHVHAEAARPGRGEAHEVRLHRPGRRVERRRRVAEPHPREPVDDGKQAGHCSGTSIRSHAFDPEELHAQERGGLAGDLAGGMPRPLRRGRLTLNVSRRRGIASRSPRLRPESHPARPSPLRKRPWHGSNHPFGPMRRSCQCAAPCAGSDPRKTCGLVAHWVFLRHSVAAWHVRGEESLDAFPRNRWMTWPGIRIQNKAVRQARRYLQPPETRLMARRSLLLKQRIISPLYGNAFPIASVPREDGPRIHQFPPLLEKIGAIVGRFSLIPQRMG